MIYFFAFSFSILTCYIGENLQNKKYRFLQYFFYCLAIVILVVLAGCRDYTVGSDVLTYGNKVFDAAKKSTSLVELIKKNGTFVSNQLRSFEILYLVLNYIVSRFSDSYHLFYAVVGSVIYIGFFTGIYKLRKDISITLGWTFYILLFFAQSLNWMRQSLAMAIMFAGAIHIINRSYLKYIPYAIVAFFFHQVSILISVAFIIIRHLLHKKEKTIYEFVIIGAAFAVFFAYGTISRVVINLGILTNRMSAYAIGGEVGFAINPFIQRIIPILILSYYTYRYTKSDDIHSFLLVIMIMDTILIQMRNTSMGLSRISVFFSIFNIYAYPYFLDRVKKVGNRRILKMGFILFFSLIWIYQTVYTSTNEIFPYTSGILRL